LDLLKRGTLRLLRLWLDRGLVLGRHNWLTHRLLHHIGGKSNLRVLGNSGIRDDLGLGNDLVSIGVLGNLSHGDLLSSIGLPTGDLLNGLPLRRELVRNRVSSFVEWHILGLGDNLGRLGVDWLVSRSRSLGLLGSEGDWLGSWLRLILLVLLITAGDDLHGLVLEIVELSLGLGLILGVGLLDLGSGFALLIWNVLGLARVLELTVLGRLFVKVTLTLVASVVVLSRLLGRVGEV
jgi:hypothetical protein